MSLYQYGYSTWDQRETDILPPGGQLNLVHDGSKEKMLPPYIFLECGCPCLHRSKMTEAFFGHQELSKYFMSMTPQCLWSIKIWLQKHQNSNRHRQTLLVFPTCWRNFTMEILLLSSVWEKSTHLKPETKQNTFVTQINKQLLSVVIHYWLQQNHRNSWADRN